MTTILLAAITILLGLILVVLFYHLPEEKQSAFLEACVRVCWIGLAVMALVSAVVIGIIEDIRQAALPSSVGMIPLLIFAASAVFYAIAHRKEYGFGWKTARGWVVVALGVLLLMWWNPPLPKPFFHLPHHLGLIIDFVVLSAIVVYVYRSWRKWRAGRHD